jgi:ABC-type Na+ efflux pump permease subunit
MSRLLQIYPRAWRDRYADEVADLLAARPPTTRDRLDLMRGAVDAWLHPQVLSSSAPRDEHAAGRSLGFAILGVLGGVMWAVGGVAQHVGGWDPMTGYKHNEGTMIVLAASVVTALAALAGGWSGMPRSVGLRRSAVAMVLFALLLLFPWPILVIGFWGQLGGTMAFGVGLHGNGRRTGVPLIVCAVVALMFNTESAMALATIPLGIAWVAVGAEAALRRPAPVGAATS